MFLFCPSLSKKTQSTKKIHEVKTERNWMKKLTGWKHSWKFSTPLSDCENQTAEDASNMNRLNCHSENTPSNSRMNVFPKCTRTFIKIESMLRNQTSLTQCKRTETMWNIFLSHVIKIKSITEKYLNPPNVLNNMLLNIPWVTERNHQEY